MREEDDDDDDDDEEERCRTWATSYDDEGMVRRVDVMVIESWCGTSPFCEENFFDRKLGNQTSLSGTKPEQGIGVLLSGTKLFHR